MTAWQRLAYAVKVRPVTVVLLLLLMRWTGIAGFLWIPGQWLVEQATIGIQDLGCTSTVAERIVLPDPHRQVEARIHRCTNAFERRPSLRCEDAFTAGVPCRLICARQDWISALKDPFRLAEVAIPPFRSVGISCQDHMNFSVGGLDHQACVVPGNIEEER